MFYWVSDIGNLIYYIGNKYTAIFRSFPPPPLSASCLSDSGLSKIPEASILVSIPEVSESELVLADRIDS